jgi:uncharacterized membrane protein
MRWLLIALLVSLVALLFAAAGVARHIWRQHARIRSTPHAGHGLARAPADETEVETEIQDL